MCARVYIRRLFVVAVASRRVASFCCCDALLTLRHGESSSTSPVEHLLITFGDAHELQNPFTIFMIYAHGVESGNKYFLTLFLQQLWQMWTDFHNFPTNELQKKLELKISHPLKSVVALPCDKKVLLCNITFVLTTIICLMSGGTCFTRFFAYLFLSLTLKVGLHLPKLS